MSDETHKRFDSISRQLAASRTKVEQTYYAWTAACREMKLLERDQADLWGKLLMRSITEGLPEKKETLSK